MFRHHSGHHQFINDLKHHHAKIKNFKSVHAHWRLQRQTMLVDPQWPEIIHQLTVGHKACVYGFTQVNTGPYEIIPSMEQWRVTELSNKNIHFTPTLARQSHISLLKNAEGYACFDHGILFTGPFSKRQLLEACLKYLSFRPNKIVFFDDLDVNIQAIQELTQELDIDYHGFHYQGAAVIGGKVNFDVIAYQQKKLINELIWLEDEAAAQELANQ